MTKAKGRARMCPCGHEATWHTGPNRSCEYGHGHVMGGCTCEAYRSGRYRDGEAPPAEVAAPTAPASFEEYFDQLTKAVQHALDDFARRMGFPQLPHGVFSSPAATTPAPATARAIRTPTPRRSDDAVIPRVVGDVKPTSGLSKCERAILTVLAQHGERNKVQVAILAGYSHTSGGFRNSLSALRSASFIEGNGDAMTITTTGRKALGPVAPLPRGRELLEYWMTNAGGKCERMILAELADVHPRALPKDDLAARTNYQVTSGGFRNALSRLRTLQLIKGSKDLKISETLAEAS